MVIMCGACKKVSPELAYQSCLDAESLYKKVGEKYDLYQKDNALTPELKVSLEKESDDLFENTKKVYADFFVHHINTPYAQKIFSETVWLRRLNELQLESVLNKVTDVAFKETDAYKNAAERVQIMKNSKPGNPYIPIVSNDPDGNPVQLSDFVGKEKYIVLEFWASWCPDCRVEMPEMVELYNSVKDKNFEFVGYSLDKTKEPWVEAIEKFDITWPQMSDFEFWNSKGVKQYAVQSIPQAILISPDGLILARYASVKDLSKKVAELVK
jgi:thiol-disulfide isomerase/thioredoxin